MAEFFCYFGAIIGDPTVVVSNAQHSAEHVRVPANVLCARMHDDVCTMGERVLEWRWGEGRVDQEKCASGVGFLGKCFDGDGSAGGVDGGFEMNEIPGGKFLRGTVERENAHSCEFREELRHAPAAVVTGAYGDGFGAEVDEGGMEGGLATGIADGGVE